MCFLLVENNSIVEIYRQLVYRPDIVSDSKVTQWCC